MFGLKRTGKRLFEPCWNTLLSEYITAIAWSPTGILAASSAAGEVVLWKNNADADFLLLQGVTETSIDCLGFSKDGQFLAAGGQEGTVKIWRIQSEPELISALENAPQWVDCLSWSPTHPLLAFSLGRYVQLWDATTQTVTTTLAFEASSVLGMSWQPNGEHLAIAGNSSIKIWEAADWDNAPYFIEMPAASTTIAWSPDSQYLASGNLDYTVTVLRWENPHPWLMRGFPGKVRNLAWSQSLKGGLPLLAASSVEGIIVWEKQADDYQGWDAKVLELHRGVIQDLAFQPNSLLLASAGDDDWIGLWEKAKHVGQLLEGVPNGYSCLAWHPGGQQLAAGGQSGELNVWIASKQGQGFG